MLVPGTQMSTKVAVRLGGKLSDVDSRAQGVNYVNLVLECWKIYRYYMYICTCISIKFLHNNITFSVATYTVSVLLFS